MRMAALLILLVWLASPALAGKNANGGLIVHTIDDVHYTTPVCAQWEQQDPGTCENASTQTNNGEDTPALIWVIASFCANSSPGVSVIYFGLNHNLPPGLGYFANFGICGPAGSLEVPDAGWPDTGGNSVAFGSPVIGDTFFNFYFLNVYGFAGAFVGTGINPTGGYAAFVDDSNPPIQDDVTRFGTVRWGVPGNNACSGCESPAGACCLTDGSCIVVTSPECAALGGVYQGDFTDCDPNPCPWACCFDDEHCEDLLLDQCFAQGGTPQGPGSNCVTADCRATGACCAPDGTCLVTHIDQCAGDFLGIGTDCYPDPCMPQACCFEDLHCEDLTAYDCEARGGAPWGVGTVCTPELCLVNACCFNDGTCEDLPPHDCIAAGGTPQGEGSNCEQNLCVTAPPAAACCVAGDCRILTEADCEAAGGLFFPDQPGCEPGFQCPPVATESRTWGRIKAGYR